VTTMRDQTERARVLRNRIVRIMTKPSRCPRCEIAIPDLLKHWENQIDDSADTVEDFFQWCNRHGWKAGRGVTVPRFIITK